MDLYCPHCGEPWDFDTLHEEAEARAEVPYFLPGPPGTRERNPAWSEADYAKVYEQVRADFLTQGCPAFRASHVVNPSGAGQRRALIAEAAYAVCGDDMDGAAALMDDAA